MDQSYDRDDEREASDARPEEAPTEGTPKRRRRGFAAMDPEKVRAIAHKGGIAAHEKGTAHRFTHEEAREAGRKGGRAPHRVRGRKLPTAERNEGTAAGRGAPTS